MHMMKRFWAWWLCFAEVIGTFQSRVVLTILYFVLVSPFGLVVRIFSDPLGIKSRRQTTSWSDSSARSETLEGAKRQF